MSTPQQEAPQKLPHREASPLGIATRRRHHCDEKPTFTKASSFSITAAVSGEGCDCASEISAAGSEHSCMLSTSSAAVSAVAFAEL